MKFEASYFLLLLIPLAGLFILALKRKEPSIIVPTVRPAFGGGKKTGKSFRSAFPLILESAALALAIIALARPQKGVEELKQRAEGIDIIIALDLSGSMRSIDVSEKYNDTDKLRRALANGLLKERIDVAKDEIKKFIERRPNDRIGLVAFAPLPYLACPPTLDHSWLLSHLEYLKPGVIGDATGIAGPLASAVKRLASTNSKRKVIVLFTDGKNNVDARVSPEQAAKIANDNKITIHTVGIGSDNAFIIMDGLFGRQLQKIEHEFDEKLLKTIAETTGGRYFAARDSDGLEKTMQEIDKLEKTNFEQPKFIDYRELAFPLISISLTMIFASFILSGTLLLRLP
jgi:Ca-activated chloride channel family protein